MERANQHHRLAALKHAATIRVIARYEARVSALSIGRNLADIFRHFAGHPARASLFRGLLLYDRASSEEWLPLRTGSINISFYFTLIEAHSGCKAS